MPRMSAQVKTSRQWCGLSIVSAFAAIFISSMILSILATVFGSGSGRAAINGSAWNFHSTKRRLFWLFVRRKLVVLWIVIGRIFVSGGSVRRRRRIGGW